MVRIFFFFWFFDQFFFHLQQIHFILDKPLLCATEEPTEKRHRLVTPVPVLNSDDDDFDDDNGPVISQSKSVGGKATAKRLMTKRSSNY